MSTHKEISVYYHPEDSGEWAKYLQTNLGAQEYQIYTILNDITSSLIVKEKTRLNMFLISPSFLELKNLNIIKDLDSHFSLALLMGVDMHDFTDAAQKWDLHDHIKEWVTFEVEESEESVRNLLMKINSMYETDPDILSPYTVLSDVTDVMTEQESKI